MTHKNANYSELFDSSSHNFRCGLFNQQSPLLTSIRTVALPPFKASTNKMVPANRVQFPPPSNH